MAHLRPLWILGLWFVFAIPGVQGGSLIPLEPVGLERLSPEGPYPGLIFSPAPFAYQGTGFDSGGGSVPTFSPEGSFNQAQQTEAQQTSIKLDQNETVTLSGAPGQTVVLNLQSFVLSDHAILTLEGTATTTFIINVQRRFSLSENAKVTLAGGLQWNHVFFNVIGRGPVVSLRGHSILEGILTAQNRTVRLRGDVEVIGEVFAKKLRVEGNAKIIQPPVSP